MNILKRNNIIKKYGLLTTHSFSISFEGLKLLVANNFVISDAIDSSVPAIEYFIGVGEMVNRAGLTFHGYIITDPGICKVRVEGCEFVGVITDELSHIFTEHFKNATEFSLGKAYFFCWYD